MAVTPVIKQHIFCVKLALKVVMLICGISWPGVKFDLEKFNVIQPPGKRDGSHGNCVIGTVNE